MSSHEIGHEGDSKKFTVTAFIAFVTVFVFVLLLSQCHGPFVPNASSQGHAPAAEHEKAGGQEK